MNRVEFLLVRLNFVFFTFICDVINPRRRKKPFFQFWFLFILFEVQFGAREREKKRKMLMASGSKQLFLLLSFCLGEEPSLHSSSGKVGGPRDVHA
jgi:hypothetical protein